MPSTKGSAWPAKPDNSASPHNDSRLRQWKMYLFKLLVGDLSPFQASLIYSLISHMHLWTLRFHENIADIERTWFERKMRRYVRRFRRLWGFAVAYGCYIFVSAITTVQPDTQHRVSQIALASLLLFAVTVGVYILTCQTKAIYAWRKNYPLKFFIATLLIIQRNGRAFYDISRSPGELPSYADFAFIIAAGFMFSFATFWEVSIYYAVILPCINLAGLVFLLLRGGSTWQQYIPPYLSILFIQLTALFIGGIAGYRKEIQERIVALCKHQTTLTAIQNTCVGGTDAMARATKERPVIKEALPSRAPTKTSQPPPAPATPPHPTTSAPIPLPNRLPSLLQRHLLQRFPDAQLEHAFTRQFAHQARKLFLPLSLTNLLGHLLLAPLDVAFPLAPQGTLPLAPAAGHHALLLRCVGMTVITLATLLAIRHPRLKDHEQACLFTYFAASFTLTFLLPVLLRPWLRDDALMFQSLVTKYIQVSLMVILQACSSGVLRNYNFVLFIVYCMALLGIGVLQFQIPISATSVAVVFYSLLGIGLCWDYERVVRRYVLWEASQNTHE